MILNLKCCDDEIWSAGRWCPGGSSANILPVAKLKEETHRRCFTTSMRRRRRSTSDVELTIVVLLLTAEQVSQVHLGILNWTVIIRFRFSVIFIIFSKLLIKMVVIAKIVKT